MPIYEYQPSGPEHCSHCRGGFEARQKIGDERLSACPRCGAPVERRVSPPHIGKSGQSLDRSNLEKHGFTQYRRAGKGVYEKTAGKGPEVIKDD
jgi:putative FmdB family regulatory protein